MKKVILTDIDGVSIQWQSGLAYFAHKYGIKTDVIIEMISDEKFRTADKIFQTDEATGKQLIEKYNNSDFIRYLAAYKDALKVINELKKDYDFIAITALGNSIDAKLNRQFNLNALFPGAFQEILMCGHTESKDALLVQAKEKYGSRIVCYIDDLPSHCEAALKVFKGTNVDVFFMPRGERTEKTSAYFVKDWTEVQYMISKRPSGIGNLTTIQDSILEKIQDPEQAKTRKEWEDAIWESIRKAQEANKNKPWVQTPLRPFVPFTPEPYINSGPDKWTIKCPSSLRATF